MGMPRSAPPARSTPGGGEAAAGMSQPMASAERSSRPAALTREQLYLAICRFADTAIAMGVLLGAFVLSNLGRRPEGLQEFLAVRLTMKNLLLLLAFGVCWRIAAVLCGLYDRRRVRDYGSEMRRALVLSGVGAAVALVFPLISMSGAFSLTVVLYFWLGTSVGVTLSRTATRLLLGTQVQEASKTLIVGTGPRAVRLYEEMAGASEATTLIGFVDSRDAPLPASLAQPMLGRLEDLEAILMRHAVDDVLIALPFRSCYAEIEHVISICERVGVRARYPADVFQRARSSPRFDGDGAASLVSVLVAPDDYRLALKRACDIIGAALGLVLLGPIMVVTAIVVRLESPGPVIFVQQRYGFHRRLFKLYKFRTMVANAETLQESLEARNDVSGPIFKMWHDPRITPVGRFLRRTSLDELPQLWNILRGDMSLVGPRPMAMRDVHRFTEATLMRRFSVRPGLTGLWQVSGRSTLDFDRWITLDLRYIDEWSLGLDFRILAKTLPVVIRGVGAA
jgi:exopolysaccharide biosynthesis polyprenyl glycosylphosphotransferase